MKFMPCGILKNNILGYVRKIISQIEEMFQAYGTKVLIINYIDIMLIYTSQHLILVSRSKAHSHIKKDLIIFLLKSSLVLIWDLTTKYGFMKKSDITHLKKSKNYKILCYSSFIYYFKFLKEIEILKCFSVLVK
jgi:hypothetical protein